MPEKGFWYMVDFKFHSSKWQYKMLMSLITLQDQNAQGQLMMIPLLLVNEACQTLGVWVAPNGNHEAEKANLRQIVMDWFVVMKPG